MTITVWLAHGVRVSSFGDRELVLVLYYSSTVQTFLVQHPTRIDSRCHRSTTREGGVETRKEHKSDVMWVIAHA